MLSNLKSNPHSQLISNEIFYQYFYLPYIDSIKYPRKKKKQIRKRLVDEYQDAIYFHLNFFKIIQ